MNVKEKELQKAWRAQHVVSGSKTWGPQWTRFTTILGPAGDAATTRVWAGPDTQ